MIQMVGHRRTVPTSRSATALVLAVLLNLALVPCSMAFENTAFEVVEEGHDCCPPKLKYEPQECCELDEASVDTRGGIQKHDVTPDVEFLVAGASAIPTAFSAAKFLASSDPPDPPGPAVPLHKQHCVYLK